MRTMLLVSLVFMVGLSTSLPRTFGQQTCYPQVTILQPPESIYEGCNIPDRGEYGTKTPLYKREHKVLSWPTNPVISKHVFPEGTGECGYQYDCDNIDDNEECWPLFLTPTIEGAYWEQKVRSQRASCAWISACPWNFFTTVMDCWCVDFGNPGIFGETGGCPGTGGGTGGGDEGDGGTGEGDVPPDGGCQECNCYYQTTYTFYSDGSGDDCWHQYKRTDYVCNGVVRSQGSDEYVGWGCGYDLQ